MKNLPDESTLKELVSLAKQAENQAKDLCDLRIEIDEKWYERLKFKSNFSSEKNTPTNK